MEAKWLEKPMKVSDTCDTPNRTVHKTRFEKLTAVSRVCGSGVQEWLKTMQYSLSVMPFEICRIASWQFICWERQVVSLTFHIIKFWSKYLNTTTNAKWMNRKPQIWPDQPRTYAAAMWACVWCFIFTYYCSPILNLLVWTWLFAQLVEVLVAVLFLKLEKPPAEMSPSKYIPAARLVRLV